jgi:hypothetical protein
MYRNPVDVDGHKAPVTLDTFAILAAFTWFVVETKQPGDDEFFLPIVPTTYACTWVSLQSRGDLWIPEMFTLVAS